MDAPAGRLAFRLAVASVVKRENVEALPGFFMGRYQGKAEYDEAFFQVAN